MKAQNSRNCRGIWWGNCCVTALLFLSARFVLNKNENFKIWNFLELLKVEPGSLGVYGCGVNPGCAMYFWRTSRIFSWRLCLLGKMSLCAILTRIWMKIEAFSKNFNRNLPGNCLWLALTGTFRALGTAASQVVVVARESFGGLFRWRRWPLCVVTASWEFSAIYQSCLQQQELRWRNLKWIPKIISRNSKAENIKLTSELVDVEIWTEKTISHKEGSCGWSGWWHGTEVGLFVVGWSCKINKSRKFQFQEFQVWLSRKFALKAWK